MVWMEYVPLDDFFGYHHTITGSNDCLVQKLFISTPTVGNISFLSGL